jgi:DUF1680 family protein
VAHIANNVRYFERRPEMPHLTRREFLHTTGAATGAVALASAFPAVTARPGLAASRPDAGVSAFPFPLGQVTLLAGPFLDNMNRTLSYLSFVDPDRLLYTFRTNVGLSTRGAAPVGGWESPTTELRGHSTGHLLSALAQAYAATGTAAYKTKGDYLVGELAACQAASPGAGFHTGYLSAYPENFFDRLESGQSVWAPYYTLHKIMAGLLDQYLLAGNTQALTVLLSKAGWVDWRTGRLTTAQMQSVLNTEFGGMNEVLANLCQATGDTRWLTVAQRFDHTRIYDPLANNTDQLAGFHGNTQLAKLMGAIREYTASGTQRYADIATNFWDIVTRHHTYVIGGNTNGEYFQQPDRIASQLSSSTCECCNTYNMLKLTRQLFFHNPARADYLDYYERALLNQILGQQDPNSAHGFVAYYTPLQPGGIKTYSNDYNNFTCDHGTGMESNTKYMDTIYFFNGETLYVNLFIASRLNWAARGITVTQQTSFPTVPSSRLTITGSGHIALKVRIPAWAAGAQVKVNGTVTGSPAPGAYLTIDRTWASGDTVDISLPMALKLAPTPDSATTQAVTYGPVVLSGAYGNTVLGQLPTLDPNSIRPATTPLQFTATADGATVTLIPFHTMHHQHYTVYWNTGAPLPPVTYRKVRNKHSGLLLGVSGMSTAAGGQVIQWDDNGTDDHLWTLVDAGSGWVKVRNRNSGLVMGVTGASTATGAQVIQWDDNGTDDHLWQFADAGNGFVKIRNRHSNLVLGVSGASTTDGAAIVQAADDGSDDHLWQLV